MTASNYVDLAIETIKRVTDAAMLVELEDGDEIWIPLSQVADAEIYEAGDENLEISVTEWWANKQGIS